MHAGMPFSDCFLYHLGHYTPANETLVPSHCLSFSFSLWAIINAEQKILHLCSTIFFFGGVWSPNNCKYW